MYWFGNGYCNNYRGSLVFYLLIPLNLSDLLLNNSAVTRIKVDKRIKQVATARIVGLNCSLKPVHICIGIVVFSKPARNNTCLLYTSPSPRD